MDRFSFLILCIVICLADRVCSRDQEIDSPIRRGIAWLTAVAETDWEPGIPAMIQYLDRRFPQANLSLVSTQARRGLGLTRFDQQRFPPPFLRLINAEYRAETEQINSIGDLIGRTTARALHCDRIPLPENYRDDLRSMRRSGGYALTHALLAAQWTIENGCLNRAELQSFYAQSIKQLSQLVKQQGAKTDLAIEAVAILFYAGAGEHVQPEWVQTVLANQREDGGWSLAMGQPVSNPHTTYLALWVLLETRYPDADDIPMIPRSRK